MVVLSHHQRQGCYWFLVALAALMAILCFLAAYLHRIGRQLLGPISLTRSLRMEAPANDTMFCNGHASWCDRPADEVVDAMADNINATLERRFLLLSNHNLDLEGSLEAGYRGIKFDIGLCDGKVTVLHHASCLWGVRDTEEILADILDFLDSNPHEVLIMQAQLIKNQQLNDDRIVSEIDTVFQTVPGWVDKLYDHPGGQWPTLRELIAADTRILFFPHDDSNVESPCGNGACPFGFNRCFEKQLTFGDG